MKYGQPTPRWLIAGEMNKDGINARVIGIEEFEAKTGKKYPRFKIESDDLELYWVFAYNVKTTKPQEDYWFINRFFHIYPYGSRIRFVEVPSWDVSVSEETVK